MTTESAYHNKQMDQNAHRAVVLAMSVRMAIICGDEFVAY